MPVYKYKAIASDGSTVEGVIDAESPKVVAERLRKEGKYLSALEAKESQSRKFFSRGVSTSELAVITRQFSTLISAGLPLEASISALVEQAEDSFLKEVFSGIKEKVTEGSSLAGALSEYRDVFSDLYINMVKAGEASGTLDIVLLRLADFLEKQAELKSKIKSALIYPAFMFLVGSGVLFFMMTYVIPRIAKIFEESDRALPFITRILIGISYFISQNFVALLLLFLLGCFTTYRYVKTEKGKRYLDRVVLKLPIFGKLASMVAISRFTRTLGTLVGGGIPLLSALEIGKNVIGNSVYTEALEKVKIDVAEGSGLSRPLREAGVFPPLVTRMIAVGEQTGEMEEMLNKIADIYDMQVDTTLSTLTSLLEPVMILLIGAIMGFIVFAVLLPIFDLTSAIG